MIVQAIDKKTGNVMYQGAYEVENNKMALDMYDDVCEFMVIGGCKTNERIIK